MKNKLLIGLLFLLFPILSHASEITTHYNMRIPAIASKDWQPEISQDIISIDSIMKMLSEDAAWINSGSNTYLRDGDSVGIGATTPLTKLEVIGFISADGLRLDAQTSCPDTSTLRGGALVLSVDTDGTRRLNFYDGNVWRTITLN